MPLTITPGYSFSNGEVVTPTKQNLASAGAAADGQSYGVALGLVATPGLYFTGDADTGLYSPTANQLSVAVAGTQVLNCLAGQVAHPAGTAAAPAVTILGDLNTGLYAPVADGLGVSLGGTERARFLANTLRIGSVDEDFVYSTGLTIKAAANASLAIGQANGNNVSLSWAYNATAASASALLATFGKANPITYQASAHRFDATSLDFAVQIFASGRVRIGGGSDDGLHALQATSFGYSNARPLITSLSYAATTDLDFSAADEQILTLAGNITFTTSNRAASRVKGLRITGDGSSRTLTWPAGWKWLGPVPTALAAGKTARLSLLCYGSADTDILAAYTVEL